MIGLPPSPAPGGRRSRRRRRPPRKKALANYGSRTKKFYIPPIPNCLRLTVEIQLRVDYDALHHTMRVSAYPKLPKLAPYPIRSSSSCCSLNSLVNWRSCSRRPPYGRTSRISACLPQSRVPSTSPRVAISGSALLAVPVVPASSRLPLFAPRNSVLHNFISSRA